MIARAALEVARREVAHWLRVLELAAADIDAAREHCARWGEVYARLTDRGRDAAWLADVLAAWERDVASIRLAARRALAKFHRAYAAGVHFARIAAREIDGRNERRLVEEWGAIL